MFLIKTRFPLLLILLIFSIGLQAQTYNVTFNVDMSSFSGANYNTVYFNSSSNSWCGTCQPMSDVDQDGIWTITTAVSAGTLEYKFTLDGWNIQEVLSSNTGSCVLTTGQFSNRFLSVSSDVVLPTVCWESCNDCQGAPPSIADCNGCDDPMYFAGRSWIIKEYENQTWGPGGNYFSARNSDVFVDNSGFLHLKIAYHNNRWYSTEVISEDTMGYGTYTFVVEGNLEQMSENIVLGLFTWDDNSFQTEANSEVDVEVSKWGDPNKQDILLYSVQPVWFGPFKPERTHEVNTPNGILNGITAHRFVWTDSLITWTSWERYADGPNEIGSWSFDLTNPARVKQENGQTSDPVVIPGPGNTTHARFNLWLMNGGAPANGQEHEVIIRNFSYERF